MILVRLQELPLDLQFNPRATVVDLSQSNVTFAKATYVKIILFSKLDYVIDKYCLFIFCYQFAHIYDVLKN